MVLILVSWLSEGLHLLCYQDAVRHKSPQWMTRGACHTLTWMGGMQGTSRAATANLLSARPDLW